mgnify:CR=1 FL=1
MKKEERQQLKDTLIKKLDNDITAIEARIMNRRVQFDYENLKDEEKLNALKLQHEGVGGIKI